MVKVKIPKLRIIPKVIPSGFLWPPEAVEERTIGRIGQMQGAKIVTNPDKNANKSKIIIKTRTLTLLVLV